MPWMQSPSPSPSWFGEQILRWYDLYGRKTLPWKHPKSPYSIWLSEIMLQQTQVSTVIPYFQRFITHFPTLEHLAKASIEEVIALWAGLGYYARARNLHKTAQQVMQDYNGELPRDVVQLQTLTGIGRSTAGAIVSQAYDLRAPILEGNVKRVLCRFYGVEGWPGLKPVMDALWFLSELVTPDVRANDYTQGVMDIGALICKRAQPLCAQCPLSEHCIAFNKEATHIYPAPRPAKEKPVKSIQFVILFNQEYKILMRKRPPKGIWGGLWCLPELTDLDPLNLEFKLLSNKKTRRHTFTHYHLDYETLLARVSASDLDYENDMVWYRLSEIRHLGLPAPHKTLLEELVRELEETPYDTSCLLSEA